MTQAVQWQADLDHASVAEDERRRAVPQPPQAAGSSVVEAGSAERSAGVGNR